MTTGRFRGVDVTDATRLFGTVRVGMKPQWTMGRRSGAVLRILALVAAILLQSASCLSITNPNTVLQNARTVLVSDCEQLHFALRTASMNTEVIITTNIRCTRVEWPGSVLVTKSINIVGGETNIPIPVIDWSDMSQAIVGTEGTTITFQNLILMQDFLGSTGLSLPFLGAQGSVDALLMGVVVGVRSCSQPVGIYDDILRGLARPEGVAGNQNAARFGDSGLFVADVSFVPPTSNSTWRICQSLFQCRIQSPFEDAFLDNFNNPLIEPSCGVLPFNERFLPFQSPLTNLGETTAVNASRSGGASSTQVAALIALVVLSAILLATLIAIAVYKFVLPKLKVENKGKDTEKEEKASSATVRTVEVGETSSTNLFGCKMELQDIDLGIVLGKGGYSTVYKGYFRGVPVAIKVIDHEGGSTSLESGEPLEAYLSKQMYHSNIVQTYLYQTHKLDELYGSIYNSVTMQSAGIRETQLSTDGDLFSNMADSMKGKGSVTCRTFIVMEYCDGGSLSQGIRNGLFLRRDNLPAPSVMMLLQIALDISRAMSYLHSMRIIHGDLKPENVLIQRDETDKRGFVCKVGDFGLSRFMPANTHIETFTLGTVTHMPPELLKDGILTPSADVYSFGMLLWRLLAGQNPFRGMSQNAIMVNVVDGYRPEIPQHFPESLAHLIRECWQQNYHLRPSFPQIVDILKGLMAQHAAPNPLASTQTSKFESDDCGYLSSEASGFVTDSRQLDTRELFVEELQGYHQIRQMYQTSAPAAIGNPLWESEQSFVATPEEDDTRPQDPAPEKPKFNMKYVQSVELDFVSSTDLDVIHEERDLEKEINPPYDNEHGRSERRGDIG